MSGFLFKVHSVRATKILINSHNFIWSRCKGQPESEPRSIKAHSTTHCQKEHSHPRWLMHKVAFDYDCYYNYRYHYHYYYCYYYYFSYPLWDKIHILSWEQLVAADCLMSCPHYIIMLASTQSAHLPPYGCSFTQDQSSFLRHSLYACGDRPWMVLFIFQNAGCSSKVCSLSHTKPIRVTAGSICLQEFDCWHPCEQSMAEMPLLRTLRCGEPLCPHDSLMMALFMEQTLTGIAGWKGWL